MKILQPKREEKKIHKEVIVLIQHKPTTKFFVIRQKTIYERPIQTKNLTFSVRFLKLTWLSLSSTAKPATKHLLQD